MVKHRSLWHLLQSIRFGVPPIFNKIDIDCELPIDTEATIKLDGTTVESGKWIFEKEAEEG